jgi:hypothetical protein
MSTRVLLLGTVFVLLTAMPVQADRLAPDHANGLQVPTGLQQQHPSDMRAVGSPLLLWPWWTDELARRR